MRLKKKRIQKMTALILTAVLIVEASVLIHSLRGRTHVPLEYVCAVDTSRNDHHEKYDPIWRTNCFPDTTKPVPKELLEHFFECDLTGVDFDENYSFVVPEVVDLSSNLSNINFFFRPAKFFNNKTVKVCLNKQIIFSKDYTVLYPPKMENITRDLKKYDITSDSKIMLKIE